MAELAIAGGEPIRKTKIPSWPQFGGQEQEALIEVLKTRNWGGYPFPNLRAEQFSRQFAEFQDAKFALLAANGTVTLETALIALGIGPGDEVIVPAYTFEATAAPVLKVQAVPVFVDVEADTYCLDPTKIEEAISPRTRAIIPVHLAMNMCDMDSILAIAKKHNLRVIEDAAHAHGAKWRNRGAGSWGDVGSFSMQTSKLLTAGEGGAISTNNEEVFEICQSYVNCGRASRQDRFGRRVLGYNYRLTEFQAALLILQLQRLPEQMLKRERMTSRFKEQLAEIPGVRLLRRDSRLTTQAVYQFVFRYDSDLFEGVSRDRFVAALEAEGIPCDGLFYEPIYKSSLFRVDRRRFSQLESNSSEGLPWQKTVCPISEKAAYSESVWIPHQVFLGEENDVDQMTEAILKIRKNLDELRAADHPLIRIKERSRADRDTLIREMSRE